MTSEFLQRVTLGYLRLAAALFILSPVAAVTFVQFCVPADQLFVDHGFHEVAITVAVATSLFLAALAYRCHRESGEALTYYLALGYLGFALLYAPHGVLTHLAHDQPALFLLWGPVSRLVMAAFVLRGALAPTGRAATASRESWLAWLAWLAVFLAIALATAWAALALPVPFAALRIGIEAIAGLLSLVGVIMLMVRRASGPTLWVLAAAQLLFVIASAAFLLARPWNAQWWLAHGISAAGFFLLGAGVATLLRTSQAFSTFYGPETLFSLLTNAERSLGELRQAKLEVEQASRARLTFFAAANHDLRQPAQAMTIFLDVLESRLAAGQPVNAVVEKLKTANHALSHILDSLLDISRLEAGLVTVAPTTFGGADLLVELAEEARARIGDRPITLQIDASCCPGKCRLHCDRGLLRRLLGNLLDNAIKFTEAGRVILRCERTDGHLRLSVQDSGPGIPLAMQAEIFEEFVQLDNPERASARGLGLGLSIVRRLARLLDASVGVSSEPGKGSLFWVELPVAGDGD